jgi:alpha-N-arabinofuranosidase
MWLDNRFAAGLPTQTDSAYLAEPDGSNTLMELKHMPKLAAASVSIAGLIGSAPAQSVEADVDAAKTHAPISRYLYGQFVEHIGNLINNGLWAEMIDDRKFYSVIPTPQAPAERAPGFGRMRARHWTAVGPASGISMDTQHAFVGKHSPRIALGGQEPRGIEQEGLTLVRGKRYVGRVVLCGSPEAKIVVSLVWGPRSTERQTVTIDGLGGEYKKFPLRFQAPTSCENARLEIAGTGSGSFAIGAVSLMPADNQGGFRREVIRVLKQLRSGVYRFPGGNYVSAHEWRDAIGDPDRRAPKLDPVWNAVQPNDVGTEEFMRFCKLVDVAPYISVNAGFGDAWSAKEYVEYCNGAPSTPMGRLRAKNGHREPYGVKFWGIGNEMWGFSYQFGAMKLSQYVRKHNDFAEAMRSVDPAIKLIGSGAMADTMTGSGESLQLGDKLIPQPLGPADWTGGLFAHCLNEMELISEHFYNYGETHYDLAKGRQVPNDPDEPLVEWMRRPANHVRIKFEEYKACEKVIPPLEHKPVPICLDEWAYAGGPQNSFKVVPAYAWAFHEMFRHSDLYRMACFTFATALFSAKGSEAVLNPTGLLFKLYRDHFGVIPVEVAGNSPQPKPTAPPGGEQPEVNAGSATFPLDVAAAWTDDRKALTIAVVNPTEEERHLSLTIANANLSGKGTLWRLAPPCLTSVAEVGREEVTVESAGIVSVPKTVVVPKHSVTIYAFEAK